MNYYERHIGDYLKDTAHLSLLEHGVYTRLMDVYYTREGAIPAAEAARLIGARSKDERQALAAVLSEFFVLVDGEHRQDRCDREIERFQDKQRKARASAEVRWGKSERNANACADAMRTHTEGNAPRARPQSPDTRPNNQTQPQPQARAAASPPALRALVEPEKPEHPDPPDAQPTEAGAISQAMGKAGLAARNPGDPRFLALIAQGATEAEFVGIAAEAVGKGKGWAWVLHVLAERRKEAAGIALVAQPTDPQAWRRDEAGIRRMQAQLGVDGPRAGEPFNDFERRVFNAWRRAGEPALHALEAA